MEVHRSYDSELNGVLESGRTEDCCFFWKLYLLQSLHYVFKYMPRLLKVLGVLWSAYFGLKSK